jgi:chromate transporter
MIIRIQSVYRIIGATIAGLAFVLPSFLIVVGLGYLYQLYGGLSWMQAVFYGVGSAVIEIIAFSAYKLTKKSIGKDWLLWSIYIVSCGVTVYTESEEILLFLTAGIIYWLVKAPPVFTKATIKSFTPISTILGIFNFGSIGYGIHWKLFWFFAKAGAFVFGSGLAIVPFIYTGAVKEYGWLNEQQFVDSVGSNDNSWASCNYGWIHWIPCCRIYRICRLLP